MPVIAHHQQLRADRGPYVSVGFCLVDTGLVMKLVRRHIGFDFFVPG